MKISELMAQLKSIQDKEGDIDTVDTDWTSIENVELVKHTSNKNLDIKFVVIK